MFKNDTLAFDIDENKNILDYYYDDKKTLPKFKLDNKDTRLKFPKLEQYKRTKVYEYFNQHWNVLEDINTNDFKQLVEHILNSKNGLNIDGRAGVGKSWIIRQLQSEMKKRGISYISLAPTNKSARVINGQTIHKFILANASRKIITESTYEYIFIDEISMVHEHFYKFFITLRRIKKTLNLLLQVILSNYYQLTIELNVIIKQALHYMNYVTVKDYNYQNVEDLMIVYLIY